MAGRRRSPTRSVHASELTANGILGSGHLEQVHEHLDQQVARELRSNRPGRTTGHLDAEVPSCRLTEQLEERTVAVVPLVAPARCEHPRLVFAGIAIDLQP